MSFLPKFKTKRGQTFGTIFALVILLVGIFVWQQNGIVTETYMVANPNLPAPFEGLRIVQVSDLHGKKFGSGSGDLIRAVADLEPDLIAITGDLIDREEQLTMVPDLAEGLTAIAPTYYVTGNHEWAVHRVNELKDLLSENGVHVLSNEYGLLEREGATLAVAGIDDPNGPADQKTGAELRGEITADYTLLLSHRDTVRDYADWGYDVVLCGHGHGGIFRIPLLDKGVLGTDRNFFPEFDGGLYGFPDGGSCVVSRGLGSNTVPFPTFRLFNRPDLPLIVLTQGT